MLCTLGKKSANSEFTCFMCLSPINGARKGHLDLRQISLADLFRFAEDEVYCVSRPPLFDKDFFDTQNFCIDTLHVCTLLRYAL